MKTVTCDGCGKSDVEISEVGYAHPVDYCASCVDSYQRIIVKPRDEFHTDLAKQWNAFIDSLESDWKKAHPNGRLPDQ